MCGYERGVLGSVVRTIKYIDLAALDYRLAQLDMLSLSTPYGEQKPSLKSAIPVDVCHFLAWKDKGEKTQVRRLSRPHLEKMQVLCLSYMRFE